MVCHDTLKSHKMPFIFGISLTNYTILKLRLCFMTKVTFSVLSLGVRAVSLWSTMYFSLREYMIHSVRAPWLVRCTNSNKVGRVFAKGQLCI